MEQDNGGATSLFEALSELSRRGPFGQARETYEAFLEEVRGQLDDEDYQLLLNRDWPAIHKKLRPRAEENILCIIC